MTKLKYIDLFAGIGGIRLGFSDSNTECVFNSEWNKFAQKTYQANFHELPAGDITKVKASDIPNFNVLLAGFPCQPFSAIGKREGFANQTQGTLFFDIVRILKYHKPNAFLLENVPGLLTMEHGKTFKTMIATLVEIGYQVHYQVLQASDFGLAQSRERIIIVGFRKDLDDSSFTFPTGNKNNHVPVKDILEYDPQGYSISKKLQTNYLFKKQDGKPYVIDHNSTVREGKTGLRLLSELECKRLQGFPENFQFPVSRTQMYQQLGNSVAVPMIKAVSEPLKAVLRENQVY